VPAWAYFDTSVLLKRYLDEQGSADARRLLSRYRVLSSAIAPLEARSALGRRRVAGQLTPSDFAAVSLRLQADRDYWLLIELGADLLGRTERVVEQTGARTLDALHIASALLFQAETKITMPFVTADDKQLQAASALGLRAIWVGAQRQAGKLSR
jgi:predicted nucleic acid-binding protein